MYIWRIIINIKTLTIAAIAVILSITTIHLTRHAIQERKIKLKHIQEEIAEQARREREIETVKEISISFCNNIFRNEIDKAKIKSTRRLQKKLDSLFDGEKSGTRSGRSFIIITCNITGTDQAITTLSSTGSSHIKLKLNLVKQEMWLVDDMGGY